MKHLRNDHVAQTLRQSLQLRNQRLAILFVPVMVPGGADFIPQNLASPKKNFLLGAP
jgi:hypothetical protein